MTESERGRFIFCFYCTSGLRFFLDGSRLKFILLPIAIALSYWYFFITKTDSVQKVCGRIRQSFGCSRKLYKKALKNLKVNFEVEGVP